MTAYMTYVPALINPTPEDWLDVLMELDPDGDPDIEYFVLEQYLDTLDNNV